MPTNKHQQSTAIWERRRKIAALYVRQMTQQEIAKALGVSQPTVSNDLKTLRKEWEDRAVEDVAQHKARHLAELSEVKRTAWQEKNLKAVLSALAQERDLLGLAAAKEIIIKKAAEEVRDAPTPDLLAYLGYPGEPAEPR